MQDDLRRRLAAEYRSRGFWTDERVGWMLDTAARNWPDREYVVFEDRRFTYRAFNDWVERIARDLVHAGMKPGERFLIQVPNRLEALALQLAAFRIGLVDVPIVPIYRQHELAHIIADSEATGVAVASQYSSRTPTDEIDETLTAIGRTMTVKYAVGDTVAPGWRAVPGPDDDVREIELPDPAEAHLPALYLYTSGTTSAPKGAKLSSLACISHVRNWVRRWGITSSDVMLVGTPLSHLGGFFNGIMLPIYTGARAVVLPAWKAEDAARIAEAEGATVSSGATLFLSDLVESYEAGRYASRPLRAYSSAGSFTDPDLIRRADRFGVRAARCYGMTEAGTLTGVDALDPLERRAEYDGRIFDGMTIQAVGDDRQPLPFGEEGELRTRGPQLMDAYTDPEVNARQMDDEGWFYTGDVGFVTEDGWIRMTGRVKDIINRGGEKFSSQDIEYAIIGHDDVREVAVAGVPDARFGEVVAAFLVLHEGVVWTGPEGILEHLERRSLAKPKFPVVWHVLDALPRNPTGKVQKNKLQELHGEGAS